MKKLFILFFMLWVLPAAAQQVTCPTRPAGDSSNACASTAFVVNSLAAAAATQLPSGTTSQVYMGTGIAGVAAPQTLTGDISLSGPAVTIAANAVSNAKLAMMPAGTIKGNNTGSTATPADLTAAQVVGMISAGNGSAANNAALTALASTAYVQVTRLGYTAQGDAPPQIYKSSNSACSLNSGAGDNGSQVPSSDGKCWLAVWDGAGLDVRQFGAVDLTGATDYSVAWQNAINVGINTGAIVNCPSGKFKINTPLNAININGLFIRGALGQAPSFGLVTAPPTTGCVLLGNTNGREVLDGLGSNSIHMSEISISSVGQATPSTVGVIFGASTGIQNGTPGGSDVQLTNVVINLPFGINTVPIALLVGSGLSTFNNVSVSGDYGYYISSNNILGITPTYGTVAAGGSTGGFDAFRCYGCASLSKGNGYSIYIEGSSDILFSRFYTAQISGLNASYTGAQYPVYLNNVKDIDIQLEDDYWPAVVDLNGTNEGVRITGLIFPGSTASLTNTPYIATIGGSLLGSRFNVVTSGGAPSGTHYWYTTSGAATIIQNNDFYFNSGYGTNVAYLNSSNYTFNNWFNGNTDTVTISIFLSGVAATAAQYRYFLNGLRQGTL